MEVGEVRIADDTDFDKFLKLAEGSKGWTLKYQNLKTGIKVWVYNTEENSNNNKALTNVRMLKTFITMEDVPAATCYDVLHDPIYRTEWDSTMIEGREAYMLNPNNDICYYAAKCPSPLKNRDFILQRTWLETPTQYIIFNHSIFHKEFPPKKGYIRGESHLTGYLVKPKTKTSCELTYVTQTDPKGTVPKWAVNKVAEMVAPTILRKLHKACQKYPAWKSVNNPGLKPWIYPEQMTLPRLKMTDIMSKNTFSSEESLEDGELKEEDFKGATILPPPPPVQDPINSVIDSSVPLPPPPSEPYTETKSQTLPWSQQRRNSLRDSDHISQSTSDVSTISESTLKPDEVSQRSASPGINSPHVRSSSPSVKSFSEASSEEINPGEKSESELTLSPELYAKADYRYRSAPSINRISSFQKSNSQAITYQSPHSQMPNGANTHSSSSNPLKYMRKKIGRLGGHSGSNSSDDARKIMSNVSDYRQMDYDQLRKELLLREHHAKMYLIQEELDMKRREHQARLEMLEEMRKGLNAFAGDKQMWLQQNSSVLIKDGILNKPGI